MAMAMKLSSERLMLKYEQFEQSQNNNDTIHSTLTNWNEFQSQFFFF